MRTLTYVVGVTLDGFVCGPDGSFGFFPLAGDTAKHLLSELPELVPTHARGHLGLAPDTPNRRYGTLVQGRGSYEVGLREGVTSPYAHMEQYVFSTTLATDTDPAVTVTGADPVETVRGLKREEDGLDLCLIGGPTLAGALLPEIDGILLKRYPVLAGAGRPLFDAEFDPTAFTRVETTAFDSGADFTLFRRAAA
ncbi:dihydrofolate reductase family protein [Nocardiopsis sp. LOL_012]|uniref:dihydrofolate reductase family protein n=1 Tax=Nocardiopsis sp. LOL_012 TaxID=3345409 RepID=UPI003A892DB3